MKLIKNIWISIMAWFIARATILLLKHTRCIVIFHSMKSDKNHYAQWFRSESLPNNIMLIMLSEIIQGMLQDETGMLNTLIHAKEILGGDNE